MAAPLAQPVRIFVSHSGADREFGIRLVEDLRRVLGDPSSVWFDVAGGLHGGDAWWRTIVTEITSRNVFLVIWSPDARESTWVNDEIDLAWQQKNDPGGKRIIPLLYRPCPLREDLRTRQFISFAATDDYERRFADLLVALGLATDELEVPALYADPALSPAAPPVEADLASVPTLTNAGPGLASTLQGQSAAPAELLLLSIDGLWPPVRLPLRGPHISIGRESGNDILVADPAVSRFHLRLVREGAGWRAETLPDARPLYVNGERREIAWLGHGDQLVIGGTVMRLEQPALRSSVTTIHTNDPRTILAAGMVDELLVEFSSVRFTAPLRADLVTLGRSPTNVIVIPSPLVSTQQAVLRHLVDGSYQLDAQPEARNPFMMAGQPLRRHILHPGDTAIIGSRTMNQYVALTYLGAGMANHEALT